MANTMIPVEERKMSPDDVDSIDRRRRRGQLFLVIGCQCLFVAVLMLLWSGQDATYSPGWARPMVYWNAVTGFLAIVFIVGGIRLRRGSNEFISY